MKQTEALDILKMEHNAFVTGAAGSGKTSLLNLHGYGIPIGITASTPVHRMHVSGVGII